MPAPVFCKLDGIVEKWDANADAFGRSFKISVTTGEDEICAPNKNGFLGIILPLKQEEKGRSIKVSVGLCCGA